jgi:chondroitin 4-sulfotransferase 11
MQHLSHACQKLNASGLLNLTLKGMRPSQFRSFLVDEKRRFVFCYIPKVACTNWKRVFLILTGKMNTTETSKLVSNDVHTTLSATYLRRLDNYTMEEIGQRLDTYYKVIFVRHPFERILSAYSNKFEEHNPTFNRVYGREIVRLFRKNASKKSLQLGHDVKFEEFVAYLLDPRTTQYRPFNTHWEKFNQLCHPCLVRYHFVGKYETLNEDADFVLEQLGVRDIVSFPRGIRRRVKTVDLLAEKFVNISAADIHRLWELYSRDFDIFDYSYPNFGANSTLIPT